MKVNMCVTVWWRCVMNLCRCCSTVLRIVTSPQDPRQRDTRQGSDTDPGTAERSLPAPGAPHTHTHTYRLNVWTTEHVCVCVCVCVCVLNWSSAPSTWRGSSSNNTRECSDNTELLFSGWEWAVCVLLRCKEWNKHVMMLLYMIFEWFVSTFEPMMTALCEVSRWQRRILPFNMESWGRGRLSHWSDGAKGEELHEAGRVSHWSDPMMWVLFISGTGLFCLYYLAYIINLIVILDSFHINQKPLLSVLF